MALKDKWAPRQRWITRAEAARRLEVSATMVAKYVTQGMPSRSKDRKIQWPAALQWHHDNVVSERSKNFYSRQEEPQPQQINGRDVSMNGNGGIPPYSESQARQKAYEAELAEITLMRAKGELCRVRDVIRLLGDFVMFWRGSRQAILNGMLADAEVRLSVPAVRAHEFTQWVARDMDQKDEDRDRFLRMRASQYGIPLPPAPPPPPAAQSLAYYQSYVPNSTEIVTLEPEDRIGSWEWRMRRPSVSTQQELQAMADARAWKDEKSRLIHEYTEKLNTHELRRRTWDIPPERDIPQDEIERAMRER
jgi:hypothetical protein